jgi:hypothetical protein
MSGPTNMQIRYEWNTFKMFKPFNRVAPFKTFRSFRSSTGDFFSSPAPAGEE